MNKNDLTKKTERKEQRTKTEQTPKELGFANRRLDQQIESMQKIGTIPEILMVLQIVIRNRMNDLAYDKTAYRKYQVTLSLLDNVIELLLRR
jgi:signal recognition particle GTPase